MRWIIVTIASLIMAACVSVGEQAEIECRAFDLPPARHTQCVNDSVALQYGAISRSLNSTAAGIRTAVEVNRPPQVIVIQQPAYVGIGSIPRSASPTVQ